MITVYYLLPLQSTFVYYFPETPILSSKNCGNLTAGIPDNPSNYCSLSLKHFKGIRFKGKQERRRRERTLI